MRGFSRMMQWIKNGNIPYRTANKFDHRSEISREFLWILRATYFQHQEIFDGLQPQLASFRSCKAGNIRAFFSDNVVKLGYHQYIEYLYADMDPHALTNKFRIFCCRSECHFQSCIEKWKIMKDLMNHRLYTELGISMMTDQNGDLNGDNFVARSSSGSNKREEECISEIV